MPGVVGRDAELSVIRDFVASVSEGATAVVLAGEPGMGKTTLWNAGVREAEERGLRVLRALPAESETALGFSGLGDLLDPVLEEALEPLPKGQRSALARALVLEEAQGPPPDAHAVGIAVLNALRSLAEAEPVVVAVDDLQWLDGASAGALAYAARRLRSERVGVLLSRRELPGSPLVDELRRCMPGDRVHEIDVGPLDLVCLNRVVHDQLGVTLPRPLLAEIHEAAGGNPFYALEITRMLRRSRVSVEAGQPLPVPESLHELVHGRLLALPPESRQFLLAAAANAHPTLSITETASGVPCAEGLPPALDARVVEVAGNRIRFTHPLLAAGAYETAEPLQRREIHGRLAELLDDSEARAWQLASSVDEPDEATALALEEAARHAHARGAPRPAALLLDRAAQLTPGARHEDAVRRVADAAYWHFEAGDSRRAEARLRDLIAALEPGPPRAGALAVLARIRLYHAPGEARALFAQVLEEAEGDRRTCALAHEGAAACGLWLFEGFEEALEHADVALELAEEMGDDALAADAIMVRVTAETLLGRPAVAATVERALELQSSAAELRVLDQPLVSLAEAWNLVDQRPRAREALQDLLQLAHDAGDESALPWLLYLLGECESTDGNLELALELARQSREAAEQTGQPLFSGIALALESLTLAHLGRPEDASQAAERALGVNPDGFTRLVTSAALGHVALALGDPGETVARLDRGIAFVRDEGIVEPGTARFVVDQVEALIELGRREEAVELLDWYEANARRLERASALAASQRCRGLLASQAGSLEDAVAAYEEALEFHAQVELPLDRGRTLLALGAAQRRAKRRRDARATLEEALAVFERIGAALWAERARSELKRISGRAATPGALTPAEEKVAALVAEGKTNREVAAALFLSDRTVEGHLSRVFGKLGIRHRAELARALAFRQTQGLPRSNAGDTPVSGARSTS